MIYDLWLMTDDLLDMFFITHYVQEAGMLQLLLTHNIMYYDNSKQHI